MLASPEGGTLVYFRGPVEIHPARLDMRDRTGQTRIAGAGRARDVYGRGGGQKGERERDRKRGEKKGQRNESEKRAF